MKKTAIFPLTLGLFLITFLVAGLALSPLPARAEDLGYAESSGPYSREELAQMLAPIALYPDALLSQVLMAATYPIEVIEADRWRSRNPGLTDATLDGALVEKGWDPSVKALCHFPSVLALMSERIAETTDLGNAFLAQEAEVMDVVQELRAMAFAQGGLVTTAQQKVIVERETIIIQPADPRVVFVPYYDPYVIYGPWWYPAYPPYYWGPSVVSIGFGLHYWPGTYIGYSFGTWSYFDWPRRSIYIDAYHPPGFVRHDRWVTRHGRWVHSPTHRRGVVYRDQATAVRYGQPIQNTAGFRRAHRDSPERFDPGRNGSRPAGNRAIIDRDSARNGRPSLGGQRQERQPVDRNAQVREGAQRERQLSVPVVRQGPSRQIAGPVKRASKDPGIARQEKAASDSGRQGWNRSAPTPRAADSPKTRQRSADTSRERERTGTTEPRNDAESIQRSDQGGRNDMGDRRDRVGRQEWGGDREERGRTASGNRESREERNRAQR